MTRIPSDLTVEQQAHLVTGVGPWRTYAVPDREIPAVSLSDGPHGLRAQGEVGDNFGLAASTESTCFPPAVAIGSSWDVEVAAEVASAIGREARMLGVDIVLGPGVNIKRSPLCGRNFEYLSEDPLLSGRLGSAYVSALQAEGVGASLKHFAVNNQETDRMRISAEVDERTLREIYLPAFERIVKEAQPATVMCSYNRINGIFASENRWLLTDVLRDEWGFKGAVVSDWGAVHDNAAAISAGLDLEMPGTDGRTPPLIVNAVHDGTLSASDLGRASQRVLGLQAWHAEGRGSVDFDEHHRLARSVATRCAVLLKNDRETLPLNAATRLAVIGELARSPRFQGGGSSHVNATRTISFLDALPEYVSGEVAFAQGYARDPGSDDDVRLLADAVELAAGAEVAVVFAGLSETDESEGFDRDGIQLPAHQAQLIRAVSAVASRTVVVLSNGGVVSLEGWHDEVDSILEGFLLGQASGGAIADLLFGTVTPSGRLAETIPQHLSDHLSTPNFPGESGRVIYGERLLVGYRAFTTLGRAPRYPFGHGLSYTTFEESDFDVTVVDDCTADVSLVVANVGDRAGGHVVQVYVDATSHRGIQRPKRELRGFAKVFLQPGETASVTIPLDKRAFAYWDVDVQDWIVTPGEYAVQLGADSETITQERTVALVGQDTAPELTLWSTLQEWLTHPIVGASVLDEVASDKLRLVAQPHILRAIGTLPMQKIVNTLGATVPFDTFASLMARSRSGR